MKKTYHILIVEDQQDDAELIQLSLNKGKLDLSTRVVSTKEQYIKEIKDHQLDLIICDYQLGAFTGKEAIEILQENDIHIPFVLVSGVIDTKTAVEIMKAGANDYVLKDELEKIALVVEKEINTFEEIKVSRKQLESAYQLAGIGHWQFHPETEELFWSNEVKNIHDVDNSFEPTLEKALNFYVQGNHRDEIEYAVEQAVKNRHPYNIEAKILSAKGNEKWIRTNGKPEFKDGKCVRLFGSIQDITEEKKTKQALEESEAKVRNILEHSTNLFYQHDPEFKFTYVSPQAKQFFGISHAHQVDLRNFLTDHPLNKKAIELTKKALETGSVQHSYKVELKREDGEIIWARVNEAPIVKDGKTVAIVGSLTDITELVEAARKEEILAKVASETENIVIITDAEQKIEWVNKAFVRETGYSKKEVLGKNPRFLQGPDTDPKTVAYIRRKLERSENVRTEILNYNKRGESYWVNLDISPMYGESGTITRFFSIQENITERKNFLQRLKHKSERLEESQRLGNIGDWDYDLDTGEVTWSNTLFNIYERDPSLKAPNYNEIGEYFFEQKDFFESSVRLAIEKAEDYSFDIKIKTEKNNIKYVHLEGIPSIGKDGKVCKLHGIVQDITDRKLTELELQQKNKQIESISNNLQGLFLRYVLQPDGKDYLEYISSGVEKVYHISQESALADVDALWSKTISEHVPRMRKSILASAKNLTPWKEEWQIKTNNGAIKWLKALGIPEQRENGEVVWDTFIQDVTEWFEAERELYETLKLSDAVLDTMPGHLFMIDSNQSIVKWNRSAKKFYEHLSIPIEDKFIYELFDDSEKEKIQSFIQNIGDQANDNIEVDLSVNSSKFTFYLSGKRLEFENRSLIILVAVNISDRKAAEIRNESLLKEVHHRVKNNLAIIIALLEMQLLELEEDNRERLPLERAIARIYSIAEVHKLLHEDSKLTGIKVKEYFESLIENTKNMIKTDHDVEFNLAMDGLVMNVNELTPLGMLVSELFTNTLKYALNGNERSRIQLKIDKDKDTYMVGYSDNGPGFETEVFEKAATSGLRIINLLLQQLEAEYELNMKNGFEINFKFKEKVRGAHGHILN